MTELQIVLPDSYFHMLYDADPDDDLDLLHCATRHDEYRIIGFRWFSRDMGVKAWFGSKDNGRMWTMIKPDFWIDADD